MFTADIVPAALLMCLLFRPSLHVLQLFEYWLHPKRYKTELCLFRANCDRPVCFFAHR